MPRYNFFAAVVRFSTTETRMVLDVQASPICSRLQFCSLWQGNDASCWSNSPSHCWAIFSQSALHVAPDSGMFGSRPGKAVGNFEHLNSPTWARASRAPGGWGAIRTQQPLSLYYTQDEFKTLFVQLQFQNRGTNTYDIHVFKELVSAE